MQVKENELKAETPKNVFRELGRVGWIDKVEDWIKFQKSKNETSHEYGEELAKQSYELAKRFYFITSALFDILKEKNKE